MRTPDIAIIGDHFMTPGFFIKALKDQGFDDAPMRTLTFPWPDEPMEHGYNLPPDAHELFPGLTKLREYQGDVRTILDFIGDAEIFITHLAPLPAGAIAELTARGHLKMIAVSRGGPVSIDIDALKNSNIAIISTPGRNASAVAEFTIGAILTETRLIRLGHEALRLGIWRGDLYRADLTGEELSQLTVGIVGYGHVGRLVIKLLRAFEPKILVVDPYVSLTPEDEKYGVTLCSLEELLQQSDVVSIHPRVSPETIKFMGKKQFAMMKKSAYFINTARGPLVDYAALYQALKQKKIRGAMLETFSIEPVPPEHKDLLSLENVTLTPHIAGASIKTIRYATEMISRDVARYVRGEPLHHLVQ